MSIQVEEENFYSVVSEWLHRMVGCQFVCKRRFLWGKQPDVLGVKFSKGNGIKADLHLVEVKIIDCSNSAYNLIGEVETRIAKFIGQNSVFHALYVYVAIFEYYKCKEIRDYANHREIGIIKLKNHKNATLSLERSPSPIVSGKKLSVKDFKDEVWIKNKDEARIFRDAIKNARWWTLKELIS